MNKKIAFYLIIFISAVFVINPSAKVIDGEKLLPPDCSQYSIKDGAMVSRSGRVPYEGWIDGEIYRVYAVGFPKRIETDRAKRKASSYTAAILQAQVKVLEYFKGAEITKTKDRESGSTEIYKSTSGIARGGTAACKLFDDNDTCYIIYDVKGKMQNIKNY